VHQHRLRAAAGTAVVATVALVVGVFALVAAPGAGAQEPPPPQLTTTAPDWLVIGASPTPFDVTLTNPADGAAHDHVRVDATFAGLEGLDPQDLTLEYQDTTGWHALPLTTGTTGTLTTSYGPATGFPLTAPYSATTPFQIKANDGAPTGSFTYRLTLVDLDDANAVLASADGDTTLYDGLHVGLPDTIPANGQPVEFDGTVANTSDTPSAAVRYDFTIDAGDVALATRDLTVEYDAGSDNWMSVPLTEANGDLHGSFGPTSGFVIPANTSNTTRFRVTAATPRWTDDSAGIPHANAPLAVHLDTNLTDVDTGATTETDHADTTIVAPRISVTAPAAMAIGGDWSAASATIVNDTGADFPLSSVRFEVLQLEGQPLPADRIQLEYQDAASGTWQPIPLEQTADSVVVGRFGPASGFPIPDPYDATTQLRVKVGDVPMGELRVITALVPPGEIGTTAYSIDTHDVTVTAAAVGGGGGGGSPTTTAPPTTTTQPSGNVDRLDGADRIDTSIAISQDVFAGAAGTSAQAVGSAARHAAAVVLARADRYPDALAGGPLAVKRNGPLLLTTSDALATATRDEIARVLPKGATVYLLGGTDALSPAVEQAVADAGFSPVRISGADRYETAVAIADRGLGNPSTAVLTTGLNFPDAVTGGAAAANAGAAVLLTAGTSMAPPTAAYLAAHPAVQRVAVGGPAAQADPRAEKVVGIDRYETGALVARRFFAEPVFAGIASGEVFADALSGGPHAVVEGGPLLLVRPEALPAAVRTYLTDNAGSIDAAAVYGGTAAVGSTVQREVDAAIG
jgi:hypothetical protein